MEIIKRGNGNQRDAQTQCRTHCRVKHPCRRHDRDTGLALQSYVLSITALKGSKHPDI